MSLAIMLIALIILILFSVPIAFSLGFSGLIYMLLEYPQLLTTIPQRVWSGTNNFVLIAMPLFILAGELMNRGGITRRIIEFSLLLVRPIKGGLGEVNVVASMIFGGISGSSVADTSAIGSVMIPNMENQGYSKDFSAGITVASSTMGMIIPPSVPMLMYAMIAGVSVGRLFLAGVIPGLLIGVTQLCLVYGISKKRKYHPVVKKFDFKEAFQTIRNGILAILMPLMIVLSVSLGIATATESAGVAVLYSLILGLFVYKELKLSDIPKILKKTVMISSSIMFIVGFTMIYTWILAVEQIPVMMADMILGLQVSRFMIYAMLVVIILLFGTFVDVVPILLLLSPILIPVMSQLGIEPLQFGTIMIVGTAIGLVTPPVGMCLNAAAKITGLSITEIFRSALPFLLCNIFILLLVTYVPAVSLWLPTLLM